MTEAMTQQQPIASASTMAGDEPTRVLLVEDDWLVARTMQQVLEGAGHGVVACVGSAQEALTAAAYLSPSLLLVDIRLPGNIDGVELVRMLREHQTIQVVFVTSHSDAATLARVADVKPEGFLVKPVSQEQLLSVVSLALQTPTETRRAATAPIDMTASSMPTSRHVAGLNTADDHHLLPALTKRQLEVLGLFMASGRVRHIAEQLSIGAPTVRNHLLKIYQKLGVHSQVELLRLVGNGAERARGHQADDSTQLMLGLLTPEFTLEERALPVAGNMDGPAEGPFG